MLPTINKTVSRAAAEGARFFDIFDDISS